MKRKLIKANIICAAVASIIISSSFMPLMAADVVGIDGGVMNANYYREYVFVDGTPQLFSGIAKTTSNTSNGKTTVKVDYNLTGSASKSTLKRSLSYDETISGETGDFSNETETETIVINGTTYTLASQGGYQLSKADTVSNNAGLDFQSGDWNCIKTYAVTGNQTGTLTITQKGSEATTDNYWGSSHFQGIKYDVSYVPDPNATTKTTTTTKSTTKVTPQKAWAGHVEVRLSAQRVGKLTYSSSLPVTTAIKGTYTRTDQKNVTAIYKYDMPSDSTSDTSTQRSKSTVTINLRDNPDIKKYVVKNLKDVSTKNGDNAIQRMTSLDILSSGSYFFQNLSITRGDFLKALMRACNIWSDKTTTTKYQSYGQTTNTAPLFLDIDSKNLYYSYIKDAIKNDIIDGQPGEFFKPDDPITKGEAATMITRALGLHDSPYVDGPNIKFKDDALVPAASKDDLYTLAKLGIFKTDSKGNIYANTKITRATAADMLNSLLNYLQTDLQKDYDSLIQFN